MPHPLVCFLAALSLLVGAPTQAGNPVHKCTVDSAVVYQSTPCPSGAPGQRPTMQQLNAERQKRAEASRSAASAAQGTGSATAKPGPLPAPVPAPTAMPYRCDGRQYCSQMTSCDEARFFLSNCSGVKMDGDHNGVPCERQWCKP